LGRAYVGSAVTARCGDAPASLPWPSPKPLVAGPLPIFRRAPRLRRALTGGRGWGGTGCGCGRGRGSGWGWGWGWRCGLSLGQRLRLDAEDLHFLGGIGAQFEQARVFVQLGSVGDGWGAGGEADTVQFLEGEGVEGDGVAAEAEFVGGGGVVEEAALAAFVLADEGVDDSEGDVVGDIGAAEDFGDGTGEEGWAGFEAEEVVGGGAGDGVEDAAGAGVVVVEEWGDDDMAGDFAGDKAAEVGFAAGDFGGGGGGGGDGFAEFEVTEDQLAEDGIFVGVVGVEAGVGGAGDTDAEG